MEPGKRRRRRFAKLNMYHALMQSKNFSLNVLDFLTRVIAGIKRPITPLSLMNSRTRQANASANSLSTAGCMFLFFSIQSRPNRSSVLLDLAFFHGGFPTIQSKLFFGSNGKCGSKKSQQNMLFSRRTGSLNFLYFSKSGGST